MTDEPTQNSNESGTVPDQGRNDNTKTSIWKTSTNETVSPSPCPPTLKPHTLPSFRTTTENQSLVISSSSSSSSFASSLSSTEKKSGRKGKNITPVNYWKSRFPSSFPPSSSSVAIQGTHKTLSCQPPSSLSSLSPSLTTATSPHHVHQTNIGTKQQSISSWSFSNGYCEDQVQNYHHHRRTNPSSSSSSSPLSWPVTQENNGIYATTSDTVENNHSNHLGSVNYAGHVPHVYQRPRRLFCFLDIEFTSIDCLEQDEMLELGIIVTDTHLNEICEMQYVFGHDVGIVSKRLDKEFVKIYQENGLFESMNKSSCAYDKVQTDILTQLRQLLYQAFGPDARFENDTTTSYSSPSSSSSSSAFVSPQSFESQSAPNAKIIESKTSNASLKYHDVNNNNKSITTFRLTPAGMSIEKDMLYIEQKMPELYRLLHYQRCDLSGLRILIQEWRQDLYKFQPIQEEPRHRALADSRSTLNLLRFYRQNLFGIMPFVTYSYPQQHPQHYSTTTQFNY